MRLFALAALLFVASACADDYAAATSAGTIDAFEAYLKDNPNGRYRLQATGQLEVLYLDEARAKGSLEAYDRYLERFPEGDLRARAIEERETFLFDWARQAGTVDAWDTFLKAYPHAEKKRDKEARRMRDVAGYAASLSWTDVVVEAVNLAEDPNGPKDGWGFTMQVTNNGDKTLSDLRFTVSYLADDGRALGDDEWPLVAKSWPVPIEEEKKVPFKPKETRAWSWTAGDLPEPWVKGARKVSVAPTRLAVQE